MECSLRFAGGRDGVALTLGLCLVVAAGCTRPNPAFKPNASRTDTGADGESGEVSDTGSDSSSEASSDTDPTASSEVDTGPESTDTNTDGGCSEGEELCDGVCVDLSEDVFNCGGCGIECSAMESCVDGGCVVGKTIFVTSEGYTGAMGGLDGADALCNSHALAGGLEGEYKAWLGDSADSPATRMNQFGGAYFLPSGAVVAESWDDLVDGSLLHPIDETEYADAPLSTLICAGDEVWSGIRPDGTPVDQNHCGDWTQADQAISHTGRFSAENGDWTQSMCMSVFCTAELSIYCVQQ